MLRLLIVACLTVVAATAHSEEAAYAIYGTHEGRLLPVERVSGTKPRARVADKWVTVNAPFELRDAGTLLPAAVDMTGPFLTKRILVEEDEGGVQIGRPQQIDPVMRTLIKSRTNLDNCFLAAVYVDERAPGGVARIIFHEIGRLRNGIEDDVQMDVDKLRPGDMTALQLPVALLYSQGREVATGSTSASHAVIRVARRGGLLAVANQIGAGMQASELKEIGRKLLLEKRYAEATRVLTQAIEVERTLGEAYALRALSYYYRDNFAVAVADCDRALAFNPDDHETLSVRAKAKSQLGDRAGARKDFEALLQRAPQVPAYHGDSGDDALLAGDTKRAIAHLTRAIELDPTVARYHAQRAAAHFLSNEFAAAIADASAALELDPDHLDARFNRGRAYLALNQFDPALADFEHTVRIAPRNPYARLHRGITHYRQGATAAALSDLNAAIQLKANDPEFYFHRAVVHAMLGNKVDAFTDAEEMVFFRPNHPVSYVWRGLIHLQFRNVAQVAADGTKATQLAPAEPHGWALVAVGHIAEKRWNAAIEASTRAIDLGATGEPLAIAYRSRAAARGELKDYEAAIPDLDRAIELEPRNMDTWEKRAAFQYERARYPQAAADATKALELKPTAPAYATRARARWHLEQYEAALDDIQQARAAAGASLDETQGLLDPLMEAYANALLRRPPADDLESIAQRTDALIAAVEEAGFNPGVLHMGYGNLLANRGQLARALAQMDRGVAVLSQNPSAYLARGLIRSRHGDLAGALADFRAADPALQRFPQYRSQRALCLAATGEWSQAAADWCAAAQTAPPGEYYTLLEAVANLRSGRTQPLQTLAARCKGWPESWARQVGRLLLSEISLDALLQAAESDATADVAGRRCEAYFYGAMLRLAAGDTAQGRALLEKCIATEKTRFTEYVIAREELARM